MKRFALPGMILLAVSSAADASVDGPVRNEEDLANAMNELREKYGPFLQSLPEPMSVRFRRSLDSNDWRSSYELGEERHEAVPLGSKPPKMKEWYASDFDDSGWERTTVPEWRFKTSRPKTKPRPRIKRARLYGCVLWCRNSFEAERPFDNKRVFLVFGGVDWSAEVWLNGTKLGSHAGYFEPFRFDVTGLLQEKNTLAVRICEGTLFNEPAAYWSIFPTPTCPGVKGRIVRDRTRSLEGFQRGDPHSGTGYGIHREVYLETVGETRITDVFARGNPAQGRCTVKVYIDAARSMPLNVDVSILPENFEGQAYLIAVEHKAGRGAGEISVDVPMPEAKPWSPAASHLYRCRVALKNDKGEVVDAHDVLFGYRSFSIVSEANPREGHPVGRMLLNDQPIMLHGSNITGLNALWYWGESEKIVDILLMLKAAGYNAVRSCQHVQFPEVREMQDRLGIMSQQDLGGYFQFHFVDVNPATWPKSIVSHDLRPKKAYFAMAQCNQNVVPLPLVLPEGKVMELWVDNDLWQAHEKSVLDWSVSHEGKVVLRGKETINIKGGQAERVGRVDLSPLSDAKVMSVALKLNAPDGTVLGTYEQEFYLEAYRSGYALNRR